MRRRDLLAGLGGVAVVGVGGYVALTRAGGDVEPVEIDLFEAPGSPGGTMQVPLAQTTTVIDLFATTCPPCKPTIDRLTAATPDAEDVQFVSVTAEYLGEKDAGGSGGKTRADVIEWWDAHGGPWPVGHDPEAVLFGRLDAGTLPHTVVIDARGNIVWTHTGVPESERVRAAIAEARG